MKLIYPKRIETCPTCKGTGKVEIGTDFAKPCKLNGKSKGYCTIEEHYTNCQLSDKIKNNWMCWRDGILQE